MTPQCAIANILQTLPLSRRPPASAIEWLRNPPPPTMPRPSPFDVFAIRASTMPTDNDLDSLKSILRWSSAASVGDAIVAQALREALSRAIHLVEERGADVVVQMSLIGLLQSHRQLGQFDWICTDRELRNWSLLEIQKRVGPLESTPAEARASSWRQ